MALQRVADFDLRAFSLDAVKRAMYRLGDRGHFELKVISDLLAQVVVTPRANVLDMDYFIGELRREVLDQDLRGQIAQETQGLRDLIIAQAFSRLAMLDPTGESAGLLDGSRRTDRLVAQEP